MKDNNSLSLPLIPEITKPSSLTDDIPFTSRLTTQRLFVKVISAWNLESELSFSYYCLLSVEKQTTRTASVESISGQVCWNQKVNFDVALSSAQFRLVLFKNSGKTEERIGSLSVSLSDDLVDGVLQKAFILSNYETNTTTTDIQNKPPKIKLKLVFTPSNQQKVSEEDFQRLKILGKGSFGTVYLVRKKDTNNLYAMKVLTKCKVIEANAVSHTMNERNILKRLDHPFLVNLKYAFQTDDHLFMVIDYLNGGELFFHLSEGDETFSEERVKFYAAEIALALGYMHDNAILYRDLKPENILLDMEGHLCIVDFGLSKINIKNGETTDTFCGSLEYMAPEVLEGDSYTNVVDWWALATMVYEMIDGLPPFWDDVQTEMIKKITTYDIDDVPFDPKYFSPECKDFIISILQRDPNKRLGSGINPMQDIKSHPWFKDIDWVKLYNKEISPIYKPDVDSITDLKYFDPKFLSEEPVLSFEHKLKNRLGSSRRNLRLSAETDPFENFSYEEGSSPYQMRKMPRSPAKKISLYSNGKRSNNRDERGSRVNSLPQLTIRTTDTQKEKKIAITALKKNDRSQIQRTSSVQAVTKNPLEPAIDIRRTCSDHSFSTDNSENEKSREREKCILS